MNAKSLSSIALLVVGLAVLYYAARPKPATDAPQSSTAPTAIVQLAPSTAAPATPPTTGPQPAPTVPASSSPAPSAPAASATTPNSPTPGPTATAGTAAQTSSVAPANEKTPAVFDLVVRGGQRVSGPAVATVRKGDDVTISITSDKPDRVHLHGYDLHADLKPGKTATLKFKANLTGRFVYELHNAGTELGAIEVFPR